jgi:hypothetical protein
MRYCQATGCSRPVSGWAAYCNTHKARARRHGDAQQQGVTKAELKPYLQTIRRRIAKNPDNPAWKALEGRWLTLVEHAHGELATYKQGIPYVRQHRLAYDEVIKLARDVKPVDVVETVLAMYLMLEQEPRRFRSDDGFRFQLARRMRALTDVNAGTWYDHTSRRVKRVYRDTAPKTTAYIGELLAEVFGASGLHIARLEQARSDAKRQRAGELWANLEQLK